jgi:gamma-glutamylcyclotransferase (GGCT)/AIG2-like uncharacterized protein YtfP
MNDELLFVYGTLRRGFANHEQLEGAEFVGPCVTAPAYAVESHAGYPVLVRGTAAVPGELYAVGEELLARLDAFEGADYRRGTVNLEGGRVALAYFFAHR